MFSILDRYIGKTVIKIILMTLFLLISLSGIIRFIEQLRSLKNNYDLYYAGIYTILTIPKDVEVFFPIAALIGSLIGLGLLASKSELVVMETSGFSRYRIALATLKTTIPLVIGIMLFSQYVMPPSEQYARNLKVEKSFGRSLLQSKNDFWIKDGDTFLYIGWIGGDHSLNNMKLFVTKENELQSMITAKTGRYDETNNIWMLYQVKQLDFGNPKQIIETSLESSAWNGTLSPDELNIVSRDPSSLSASGLYQYASYLKSTGQDDSYYMLVFWQKMFEPISIAVMVLLALSYIFGPLRSVSMGGRIIAGITTGFIFYIMNNFSAQIAIVYGIPPILGALMTSFLFFIIAFFLFRRKQ